MQVGRRSSTTMRRVAGDWPKFVDAMVFMGLWATRNEREASLRQAQMRQLLYQFPGSSFVSIVVAICLALALRHEVQPGQLAAWLGVVIHFICGAAVARANIGMTRCFSARLRHGRGANLR